MGKKQGGMKNGRWACEIRIVAGVSGLDWTKRDGVRCAHGGVKRAKRRRKKVEREGRESMREYMRAS